jgi:transposase
MNWEDIIKNREIKIPKKRKKDRVDTSKYYTTRFKQSEPVRRSANSKRLKELEITRSRLEPEIEFIRNRLKHLDTPFSQLSEDEKLDYQYMLEDEPDEYPDAKSPEDVYNQEKREFEEHMIKRATEYGSVLAEIKKLKEELGE